MKQKIRAIQSSTDRKHLDKKILADWAGNIGDDLADIWTAMQNQDYIYDFVTEEELSILSRASDILMDTKMFLYHDNSDN